ncbi:MAG: RHS repeat-associated core domain-containing protein [Clostridia bacterium]|nr:RHS repeat-associated core domain-containing protein [Clostridia bacterium]
MIIVFVKRNRPKQREMKRSCAERAFRLCDGGGYCKVLNADGSEITDDTHIGIVNPFRYRSYYYDIGIGLYFLKTRYYDPEIGRFMTIDDLSYLDPESINGLNLYAYCLNNPVNCVDPNGTFVLTTAILIGLIAGAVIGGTVGGIYAYNQASAAGATGWSLVGQTLLGVLGGGLIGAAIGGIVGYAAPFISAFLSTSFPILMPVNLGGVIGYTVVATVTGAQIVGGAAVVAGAGLLMFAKGSGARMGHNQHEKQMWEEAKRLRNIEDKDLARRIHDKLKQYPYAETLDDLLNIIDDILTRLGKR